MFKSWIVISINQYKANLYYLLIEELASLRIRVFFLLLTAVNGAVIISIPMVSCSSLSDSSISHINLITSTSWLAFLSVLSFVIAKALDSRMKFGRL